MSPDELILELHVQPRAAKDEIVGYHGDRLKVRITAPPVDGKANDCLIAFLSERLGVPKARVVLEAGSTSRQKRVRVLGMEAGLVEAALTPRAMPIA